jgi:apolipoprotein N-acyltransferase
VATAKVRSDEATSVGVVALARWARAAVAAVHVVSRASLVLLLVALVRAMDPPLDPETLAHLFVRWTVAPGLAAWMLARALAARVTVRDGTLAIERADRRVEVPLTALARVVPWRIPLPGPGVTLVLHSGRRVPWGLQTWALADLLRVLGYADAGGQPAVVYAEAGHAAGAPRWYHVVAKYVLFAFPPAAVLFNAHQHIAFGGLFGEYYLMGPRAWLETFAVHWATVAVYLVLYAGTLRVLAEGVALLAAYVAPSRAARVRRAVEAGCRLLYYGGVPVLLLIRFLP